MLGLVVSQQEQGSRLPVSSLSGPGSDPGGQRGFRGQPMWTVEAENTVGREVKAAQGLGVISQQLPLVMSCAYCSQLGNWVLFREPVVPWGQAFQQ